MQIKKKILFLLLVLIILSAMSTFAFASNDTNYSTSDNMRSEDHEYTLDFSASTTYLWYFNNDAFLWLNHDTVTVKYISNTPINHYAKISVELWHDSDGDGTYESCNNSGTYSFTIQKGSTLEMNLPFGTENISYMLKIKNLTNSVTSATIYTKTS